jgi:hypothetical protein
MPHGAGRFTNIYPKNYPKNHPNVCILYKYIPYMEHMGSRPHHKMVILKWSYPDLAIGDMLPKFLVRKPQAQWQQPPPPPPRWEGKIFWAEGMPQWDCTLRFHVKFLWLYGDFMLISYGDLVGFCGIKLSKEDGIRIAKTGD